MTSINLFKTLQTVLLCSTPYKLYIHFSSIFQPLLPEITRGQVRWVGWGVQKVKKSIPKSTNDEDGLNSSVYQSLVVVN